MHLWNETKLAKEMREGPIPPADELFYLLVWLMMAGIFSEIAMFTPHEKLRIAESLLFVFSIMAPIITALYCYRLNLARDGRDFITRFIALGAVALIKGAARALEVLALGYIVILSVERHGWLTDAMNWNLIDTALWIAGVALFGNFFAALRRAFMIVAGEPRP